VNQPDATRKLKPGRRTAALRFQGQRLYYSFTMLPAQSGGRLSASHFNGVWAVRITRFQVRLKSNVNPSADRQRFLNAKCRY
jgi:hypothetical protein